MSAPAVTPALRAHRAAVVDALMDDLELDAIVVRMFDNVRWVTDMPLADYPEQLMDGFAAIVHRDGRTTELSMFADQVAEAGEDGVVPLPACYSWSVSPQPFVDAIARTLGKEAKRIGVDELPAQVQQGLKGRTCVPIAAELQRRRAVKHPDELAIMRQAAGTLDQGVAAGLRRFAEGGSEREAGAALAAAGYERGIEGISHVLFRTPSGDGVSAAHGSPYLGERRLADGETARIDAGFYVNGYASDIARTVVRGHPSPSLADAYARLCEIYDATMLALQVGSASAAFWNVARDRVESLGCGPYRMLIGHGIGLRVTEVPMITGPAMRAEDVTFEANMVIAVEFHLTHDGQPLSLEDVWIVTETGPESITGAPRSLTLEAE